jgi:hypothetical protein
VEIYKNSVQIESTGPLINVLQFNLPHVDHVLRLIDDGLCAVRVHAEIFVNHFADAFGSLGGTLSVLPHSRLNKPPHLEQVADGVERELQNRQLNSDEMVPLKGKSRRKKKTKTQRTVTKLHLEKLIKILPIDEDQYCNKYNYMKGNKLI